MRKINFQNNVTAGLAFGLGTGALAAAGIWGSRYVSKLPNLPLKSALVVGGSSFIAAFTAFSIIGDLMDGDHLKIMGISILILGGALTAVGNKKLVGHDISILSSLVTFAVPQTALMLPLFVMYKNN